MGKKNNKETTTTEKKPGMSKPMTSEMFLTKKRINVIFSGEDVKMLQSEKGFTLTEEMVDRNVEDFVREQLGLGLRSRAQSAGKRMALCEKLGLASDASNSQIQSAMLERLG